MLLRLYNYTDSPVRVDKYDILSNAVEKLSIDGYVRDTLNIENPIVMIETNSTLNQYNYAYIREYESYYFLDKPIVYRTGIIQIQAHMDVLMTFRNEIKNLSGIVGRNEHYFNTQLIDERMRFLGYKDIGTISFPGSVRDNESYILAVNGR